MMTEVHPAIAEQIEKARAEIAAMDTTVAMIDGPNLGTFLVLTYEAEQIAPGQEYQAVSLSLWEGSELAEANGLRYLVPFFPHQLEEVAEMLLKGRKILEANGLVAKPGAEN